jgi:anti-sigma-K factor RskA
MSEHEMGCEEFANVAAELALGVLTGRERAQALAHLDRCDACRAEVRQLTLTGEELLGLLPPAEPPAGFETRVLARIGIDAPAAAPAPAAKRRGLRLPRWFAAGSPGITRRMLATAAVVAALAVAVLGGWGLRSGTSTPAASSQLTSAALLSADHQTAGTIFLYNGTQRWLYMSVDMSSVSGSVTCQVVGKDGHVTTVGSFWVTNGYGSWGSPTPAGTGPLTGARLVSANGAVLATASFAAA